MVRSEERPCLPASVCVKEREVDHSLVGFVPGLCRILGRDEEGWNHENDCGKCLDEIGS